MVQAKPAIPGMTPGAIVPQSDEVEPGFTPTRLPSAGPAIANVQAPEAPKGEEQGFFGEKASLNNWAPEMNTLYDTQTGKPTRLKYEEMTNALLEGRVGFKKGTAVPMIGTDSKSYNMPAENVNAALSQGYRLETPQEIAVREFAANNRGISGAAKAFLTNFADEAFFGVPGIWYEHSENVSDLERAKLQVLKKENPIANAAGGIGGFAASMFYGGEFFQLATKGGRAVRAAVGGAELAERAALGAAEKAVVSEGENLAAKTLVNGMVAKGVPESTAKAIAPGLLKSTAANMAKYGLEGAVITAPKTITEAYYDPELAAEHLAIAIGTGAALGTLGPLGRGFTNLTRNMVEKSPEMFTQLRPGNLAMRAAGAERGTARKLGGQEVLNGYGKILLGEGELTPVRLSDGKPVITGATTRKTLEERVGMLKRESGEEIGSILRQLEEKSAPVTMEQMEQGAVPGMMSAKRPDVTGMIEKLKTYREEFMDRIKDKETDTWINVVKPIYRKEVKELDRIIANVENKSLKEGADQYVVREGPGKFATGYTINFGEAQALKQEIGELARWEMTAKGKINEVRQNAYQIVRSELDSAVEKVASEIDPALAAVYKQSKLNYAAAEDIGKLLENASARDSNKLFGLGDVILGGGVGAGSIAAAIMSGNFIPLLFPILSVAGKKMLETTWLQTGVASALKRGGESSGILFAEQALKYGAEQMDRLFPTLTGQVKKVSPPGMAASAISRFLGPNAPKDKQEAFKQLATKINEVNMNPQQSADNFTAMAQPLAVGGAPKLSQAYIQQTIKTFQYLQSILPNADKSITPFKKNIAQVSDQDLMKFERALRIVENPYNIIDSLATGTTTKQEVDTLQAIYPTVYREMINKITELAYSGKASELPYQVRLKLSLLMGIKLDQSLQDVSAYQANFSKPSAKAPAGSKVDIITPKGNPYQTPIQKTMFK